MTLNDKYRINPDFVAPEPTPADMFSYYAMPTTRETFDALCDGERSRLRKAGAKQWRASFFENDEGPYPDGIWFEAWRDANARQLPFGTAWPTPESAIWPPLTAPLAVTETRSAKTAKQGLVRRMRARKAPTLLGSLSNDQG